MNMINVDSVKQMEQLDEKWGDPSCGAYAEWRKINYLNRLERQKRAGQKLK